MSKTHLKRFLPLILMLGPIVLFIVLFTVAALLMEGADTFGVGEKTQGQEAMQTVADLTALTAAGVFTILIPVGFISGIVMLIARRRAQATP